MKCLPLIAFTLVLISGCSSLKTPESSSGIGNIHSGQLSENKPIVITSRQQLAVNVGEVVTLRGIQSRAKIPHVLGIAVEGDYRHSDELVEVTGLLTSYEITQQEADQDELLRKTALAAHPPLYAGTFYRLQNPETGEHCETKLAPKQ